MRPASSARLRWTRSCGTSVHEPPVDPDAGFARDVRRITRRNPRVEAAIDEALQLLAADAFDPRLGTHKLSGDLAGLWACTAGYDLRIVFAFREQDGVEVIILLSCGTHDDVY